MIGNSPLSIEENSEVTVGCETYEGSEWLRKLITLTNVDRSLVMFFDMTTYERIRESTSGILSYNVQSEHIKTVRMLKYRNVIIKVFSRSVVGWAGYPSRRDGGHSSDDKQFLLLHLKASSILILVEAGTRCCRPKGWPYSG